MDGQSDIILDETQVAVHFSRLEDTVCTLQVEDDKVFYWQIPDFMTSFLFTDFVTEIVDTISDRNTERFSQLFDPFSSLWDELQRWNKKRVKWFDGDKTCSRIREACSKEKSISNFVFLYPSQGNIKSVDVRVNDEIDPTGELRRLINQRIASTKTAGYEESDVDEETDEVRDAFVDETYSSDEEEEIDEQVQSNPERPCYYPSQIEMAAILKQRIDIIMFHYHNISRLSDAFDDVEFAVYTARYRMLSYQTEKRIRHPDAGVLSTEELKCQRHNGDEKKRMFMYVRSAETEKHFEELKEEVEEKPKTLFVIIADECHWGITKDKENKSSAHNLFINEWCKASPPRNVIVVQISATPFNLLTQNSRLPVVQCVLLNSKMTTCQRDYEKGELVVLEREPNMNEEVRKASKELELHVVHWSEVELKNFERGMQMKLKSTLNFEDVPYRFLQVSQDRNLRVTSIESEASDFIVQGSHGIVTLKVFATGQQFLTVAADEHGNLKAAVDPLQPTTFEVKLDFGVGVVAFCSTEKPDHYIAVDEHEHVTLQAAKVERKCGVCLLKPRHQLAKVAFQFYIDQSGPVEVGMVGKQYMSLNHYLSTIHYSDLNDQKIREDKFFQRIVDKAKRQKMIRKTDKAKSDNDSSLFPIDALLCGEYCYHILHASVYHNDEKIRRALTSVSEYHLAAEFKRTLNCFIRELAKEAETKKYIHPEAFELVRNEIRNKVITTFKSLKEVAKCQKTTASTWELKELNEVFATSFVACLMHLSQKEVRKLKEDTKPISIIEDIEQQLQENGCQAMVEKWNHNIEEFETASMIKNLIHSGKGEEGKMKIVRAKSMETADQFFNTLRLARTVSGLDDCFEVIKDYGGIQIENQLMKSSSPFFQKLQPVNCTYKFPDCSCPGLMLQAGRKKCVNCQHVHKLITQYEDLENLACVLILVDKGRMGDTFPQSFDCLDLRLSYDNSPEFKEGTLLFLSTLIQELGRMCRYAKVPSSNKVQSIPHVLVGRDLFKKLKASVEMSPSMSAISCTRADRYMTKIRRNKATTSSSLRWLGYEAHKDSYDHQNQLKHPNRILLQAEPQIGKTGTYLCLIKDLRLDILGKEKVYSTSSSTAFDEGAFYCPTDNNSSEEFIASNNVQMQDWKFPYWKTIQYSRSLHDKTVAPGKYSIGGRFYTHDTEENPYILMKREAQNRTKTSYYYEKTDCKDAKLRAWPWYHLENCGECGRFLQGKESVLQDVVVNIDGTPVTFTCSLPSSCQPYNLLLQYLRSPRSTNESFASVDWAAGVGNAPTLPYWIFHPSHRDDPRKCTLNYHHVMQEKGKVVRYVQVVVVRSEMFEAYRSTWGKMLAIFQLPEIMPNCELGPCEGGVGYARLFIQKVAFSLNLEYVFVIDDNVAVMSQAVFTTDDQFASDAVVVRDDQGLMKMERCSFFKSFTHLSKIAEGKDIPPHSLEPYPFKNPLDGQRFPLYRYTGPAKLFNDKQQESYGVLGLLRSVPRAVNPFSKTQVYATILLNVKSTVEKGVFYRPWPCWEDLRFNDDCDKEGLWVVKCNRFHFLKVQYNDWINSLALPSIFEWKDDCTLEERPDARLRELPKDFEEGIILEHLRKFVISKGPEKCFKGSIGNSQQDNNEDPDPARIVQQVETKQEAFVDGTEVVILSYFAANRTMNDILDLNAKFCSTKEEFLFVTSAKEVIEECHQVTPAAIPKFICCSQEMRARKAQFKMFSAADPRRHSLRYILIEASFPQDKEATEEVSDAITQESNDNKCQVHIREKPNMEGRSPFESVQDRSTESKDLKRPLQESPNDPVQSKRQKIKGVFNLMPSTGAEQVTYGTYIPQDDREGDVLQQSEEVTKISAKSIKEDGCSLETSHVKTVSNGNSKVKRLKTESVADKPKHKKKDKHGSTPVAHLQDRVAKTTDSSSSIASTSEHSLVKREEKMKKVKNKKRPSSSNSKVSTDNEMMTTTDNVLFAEDDGDESTDVDDCSNVSTISEGHNVAFIKGGSKNKIPLNIPKYIEGTNLVTGIIVDLWREYKEILGYTKIQIQERGNCDISTDEVSTRLQDFTLDELNACDEKGYTALLKACSLPSMSPHVMQYLITTRKVDLNCQLPLDFVHPTAKKLVPGMSALSVAIRSGNVKSVPTFMTRPGNIAVRSADHDGNTALHFCVLSCSKTSFQKLFPLFEPLEWKEMRNSQGMNPLDVCLSEIESRRQSKGKERSLEYLEYMREEMEKSSQT